MLCMSIAIQPVHPRACGERAFSASVAPAAYGSSPRLRGTPTEITGNEMKMRFIPAPAGNAVIQ